SRRRHTRLVSDWSSDVCSSDLARLHDLDLAVEVDDLLIELEVEGEEPLGGGRTGLDESLAFLDFFELRFVFQAGIAVFLDHQLRSEERRVGKECGSGGCVDV